MLMCQIALPCYLSEDHDEGEQPRTYMPDDEQPDDDPPVTMHFTSYGKGDEQVWDKLEAERIMQHLVNVPTFIGSNGDAIDWTARKLRDCSEVDPDYVIVKR